MKHKVNYLPYNSKDLPDIDVYINIISDLYKDDFFVEKVSKRYRYDKNFNIWCLKEEIICTLVVTHKHLFTNKFNDAELGAIVIWLTNQIWVSLIADTYF